VCGHLVTVKAEFLFITSMYYNFHYKDKDDKRVHKEVENFCRYKHIPILEVCKY
jgi:hypothetical protein